MDRIEGKHLIIRADASTEIGTGHLMRCLALAQAWKDAGGKVTFISDCQSDGLLSRLREENIEIHHLTKSYPDESDWNSTKEILAASKDAWVVLDGYHFDEAYQQRVKESGHRLLVIDDMAHLKHYYADIVLNQNLHAEQQKYSCEPYTRLLLGTQYVLLRREFLAWQGWKREMPRVACKVLVTMGGGDPDNQTMKVIQALQEVNVAGLEAVVLLGASNPFASIMEVAAGQSKIPVRLIRDARNMPELMAWADVAISAAGSTSWELAFMGIPAILFVVSNDQIDIAKAMALEGAAIDMGWCKNVNTGDIRNRLIELLRSKKMRSLMSHCGQQLVDGDGRQRVASVMKAYEVA